MGQSSVALTPLHCFTHIGWPTCLIPPQFNHAPPLHEVTQIGRPQASGLGVSPWPNAIGMIPGI